MDGMNWILGLYGLGISAGIAWAALWLKGVLIRLSNPAGKGAKA